MEPRALPLFEDAISGMDDLPFRNPFATSVLL